MKCIEMDSRLGCKVKYMPWKQSVCCLFQAPAFLVFLYSWFSWFSRFSRFFPGFHGFPGFPGFPVFSGLEAKCVLPLPSTCFSSISRWHCLLAEAYDQRKVFMKSDRESSTLFSSTKPKLMTLV